MFERKSLFRLTFPLFVYAFVTIAVSLLDTMLLSAHSQELAAAVGIANQILGVAYDLSGLLAIGGLVLIAQHLGRGDIEGAKRVGTITVLANTALSVGIAAVLWIGSGHFVSWVNTPPDIVRDAETYIRVIALAMICNGFFMAAAAVLRGFGRTVDILVLGLLANGLYLFLEYALIFGRFGLPALGAFGSALSTLIVRVAGVFCLWWVLKKKVGLNFKLGLGWTWKEARRLLKPLNRLSWPSVSENIAYNVYQLMSVSFIAGFGITAVLTRSYTLSLMAFMSLIISTMSQGNEILVGYDKGGGFNEQARRRGLRTALGTALVVMALAFIFWMFSRPLIGLFTKDEALIRDATSLLALSIFIQPLNAINLVLYQSLRAVGDVLIPAVCNLVITWALCLPLAWYLVAKLDMGVLGLWLAFVVEELIKGLYMLVRWQRMRWASVAPVDDA